MRIKIYDKDYNPLTTLINGVVTSDFNNLQYSNKVNAVGDASFLVRIDNPKITPTSIQHYNKLEITEDDGTVKWTGLIIERTIQLNIIQVKCYGLAHILDKRVTQSSVHYATEAGITVTTLLSNTNTAEQTGITAGEISLATAVDLTFQRTKVLQAIKSVADAVDGQYLVNNDRTLDFKEVVGNDLTESVIFRFEKATPELANILKFQVQDIGREIISKTYGKSDALTSTQENETLKNLYGLLEQFENYREIGDQTTLDNRTLNNNKDSELSPKIELSPAVPDNFEAGDIVKIKLNNGFTQLDGNYQIMEKDVNVINNQKLITIKINQSVANFTDDIKKLRENVNLLNTTI